MPEETADGFTPGADLDDHAPTARAKTDLRWRGPECGSHGSCVEIADLAGGGTAIRDGKAGDAGPVLRFTASEWDAFTTAIRTGELG